MAETGAAVEPQFVALQTALAGRYSLERELGRGGMGIVYLARDVALDRLVAIKLLPPELAADATARERFLREARTAAGLSHPNVVPVHLVEERQGLVYFVMGYVEGETLGDRVRRAGALPLAEAVRVVQEVAWALAYAHRRGVIHRDIKPDNVLLEKGSGRAMVTDFGIARVATRATVSQEGELLGSLQFMAPEQADPQATVDHRVDLYALGVTSFYALAGCLPFEAGTAVALLAMHLTEPAPPLASVRADVPARVAEAVDRCLAKDPATRFPNAEALADALGDAVPAVTPVPPAVLAFRDAANGLLLQAPVLFMALFMIKTLRPEAAGPAAAVLLTVLGLQGLILAGAARDAARAGFSPREIADAMVAITTTQDAHTRMSIVELRRLSGFLRRPFGRVVMFGVGLFLAAMGIGAAVVLVRSGLPMGDRIFAAAAGLLTLIIGGLYGAGAFGRGPLANMERRYEPNRRLRVARLLYDNPLMRALFWLARFGLKRPKQAPVLERAPTEVMLGRAADESFLALGTQTRRRLGDVPGIIRNLERAAQSLRARRGALERAMAEVGEAGGSARRGEILRELEVAKSVAAGRLQTAVTALENLRLDLLRLRAGVGQFGELTGAVEAARRVSEEVSAALEAQREITKLAPQ